MAKNTCELLVETLLIDHKISYERSHKGKHIKFVIDHNGQRRPIVVSTSVSDHRGKLNLYTDTRKVIKSLGIEFKDNKALCK